jgi:hypothetical protein
VQNDWAYLEGIFKGQPDLAKQLPQEDATFRQVDQVFTKEMTRIREIKKAYPALVDQVRDFMGTLNTLLTKLEVVQKKLHDLLAQKRSEFPRFFFLPNSDLLEIIGQTKDPNPINRHIGKIFEGINTFIAKGGNKGSQQWHIEKVVSADKEELDLGSQLYVEVTNKVEYWLRDLERHVKEALQK